MKMANRLLLCMATFADFWTLLASGIRIGIGEAASLPSVQTIPSTVVDAAVGTSIGTSIGRADVNREIPGLVSRGLLAVPEAVVLSSGALPDLDQAGLLPMAARQFLSGGGPSISGAIPFMWGRPLILSGRVPGWWVVGQFEGGKDATGNRLCVLTLSRPFVTEASLYTFSAAGVPHQVSADARPDGVPLTHLGYDLCKYVEPGAFFAVHLRPSGSLELQMKMQSVTEAFAADEDDSVFFLTVFFLSLCLSLICLALYFIVREPLFLIYSAYQMTSMVNLESLSGLVNKYLFPGMLASSVWGLVAGSILMSQILFFLLRGAFHTKETAPRLHKLIYLIPTLGFVNLLAIPVFGVGFVARLIVFSSTINYCIAFLVALCQLRTAVFPTRIYAGTIILATLLVLLFILRSLGFPLPDFCNVRLIAAARLIEALGFCLGLALSVRHRRDEFERRQILDGETAKMVLLGDMAAGIAHEINNPLFVIQGAAMKIDRVAARLDGGEAEILENLTGAIEKSSSDIAKIVSSLKILGRDPWEESYTTVQVRTLFNSAATIIGSRLAENHVTLEIGAEAGSDLFVKVRPPEMLHILLDLLAYAVDAVEGEKIKTIRLGASSRKERIFITVDDSGKGLAEDRATHISHPFFTTKPPGRGAGLRLAISRTLIERSGGRLLFERTPDQFTRFTVELPAAKGAP